MKTTAALVVSLVLILSLSIISNAEYARVSESVNLRESPSTDARVLKLVPMGYEITPLSENNGWTKASFEGVSGYIKSDYVEVIQGQPPAGVANTQSASAPAPESSGSGANGGASGANGANNGGLQLTIGIALRYGSEGEAVRDLQKLLTDKGFYTGPINGKFGPMTEEAVMIYQHGAGLEIDGVVGIDTLNKLIAKPRPPGTYRQGDEGDGVKKLQQALKDKKFYTGPVNGKFGPLTEDAVIRFQKANNLEADGIVGRVTLEKLNAPSSVSGSSGSEKSYSPQQAPNGVELIRWQDVKSIIGIGRTAKVYDIRTGVTYNVRSFSNGNHADVEPVTVEDTEALKHTFGGTWSWTPRPVWVTVNGRTIAASINGMPHGGGVNNSNGMNGQICLHFLGSSTHNNNHEYTQLHQDTVNQAWAAARK